MSFNWESHPPRAELIAFGTGSLDDIEATRIASHLERCPKCCETMLDLQDDTFVSAVRKASERAKVPDNSACREFADRPEPSLGITQVGRTVDTSSIESASANRLPENLRSHARYEVSELIGRGGMGDVYRAEHKLMNRTVALKVIKPHLVRDENAVLRFRREVQAAARLNHENIVAAYDAEQAGEIHFLVMEFVSGVNLNEVLQDRGALPIFDACRYVSQAAHGLQHAHQLGMVHRDIKPHNLMLTEAGNVKILDFGLASLVGDLPSDDKTKTESHALNSSLPITNLGAMMGTPDFIAPEQAEDARNADIRSDIYSLGCTLFTLLTGRTPFCEGNASDRVRAHMDQNIPPASDYRPDVPRELEVLLKKMTAKDPDQRFNTPDEISDALERFVVNSDEARESSALNAAVSDPSNNRVWIACTLAASCFFLLASIVFYVRFNKGVVSVEVLDENIEVLFKNQEIIMKDGKKEISVAAGEHSLIIKHGESEFETESFKLRRNGEIAISARLIQDDIVISKDGVAFDHQSIRRNHSASLAKLPPSGHWMPLFNGRDLSGWTTHADQPHGWSVEEGILTGRSDGRSHLFTQRGDFADFHLRAEAKVSIGGNSGIFFGSPFEFVRGYPVGYEAQIIDDSKSQAEMAGSLLRVQAPPKPLASLLRINRKPRVRSDQWFVIEIIAKRDRIVVKIDDEKTADFFDLDQTFRTGHLVLQALSLYDTAAQPTKVQFRRIEVAQPPSSLGEELSEIRRFEGHLGSIKMVAISPDGRLAISASGFPFGDGTVRLWDMATGEQKRILGTLGRSAKAVCFSPDGKHAAASGMGRRILIWSLESDAEETAISTDMLTPEDLAYSPDGRYLLAVGHGKQAQRKRVLDCSIAQLWNATTGDLVWQFECDGWLAACGFLPRKNAVVVAGFQTGAAVHVLDRETGAERQQWKCHDEMGRHFESIAVSPKDHLVATVTMSGHLCLWNDDGKLLRTKKLTSQDTPFQLQPVATCQPTLDSLLTVKFCPDGRNLVTAGHSQTVHIVQISDLQSIAAAAHPPGSVWTVAISQDGRKLLTGGGSNFSGKRHQRSGNYALHLWELPQSQQTAR